MTAPMALGGADPLAELIGRPRAGVLRALTTPKATTFLAEARGVTPAAVSHHLSALHANGLVSKQRCGRFVFYSLTPLGQQLLGGTALSSAEVASRTGAENDLPADGPARGPD